MVDVKSQGKFNHKQSQFQKQCNSRRKSSHHLIPSLGNYSLHMFKVKSQQANLIIIIFEARVIETLIEITNQKQSNNYHENQTSNSIEIATKIKK